MAAVEIEDELDFWNLDRSCGVLGQWRHIMDYLGSQAKTSYGFEAHLGHSYGMVDHESGDNQLGMTIRRWKRILYKQSEQKIRTYYHRQAARLHFRMRNC